MLVRYKSRLHSVLKRIGKNIIVLRAVSVSKRTLEGLANLKPLDFYERNPTFS
jgi:hypothetical protein